MPNCPNKMHMMPNGKCMKDSDMKSKKIIKKSKKMPPSVLAMFRAMRKK